MRISDWSSDVCSSDLQRKYSSIPSRNENGRRSLAAGGPARKYPQPGNTQRATRIRSNRLSAPAAKFKAPDTPPASSLGPAKPGILAGLWSGRRVISHVDLPACKRDVLVEIVSVRVV